MAYFDTELKTTLLFALIGAIAGYISFAVNNTAAAPVIAVVVFLVLYYAAKKALKIQEEKKWWITMAVVHFFMWLIVWTVLYNYALL